MENALITIETIFAKKAARTGRNEIKISVPEINDDQFTALSKLSVAEDLKVSSKRSGTGLVIFLRKRE